MNLKNRGFLAAVASVLSVIVAAGCAGEPVINCWNWNSVDSLSAPPFTEEFLFACKANPEGVAIRRDGGVVLVRAPQDARAPWGLPGTAVPALFTIDRAELNAARADLERLPPMTWPSDPTLADDLECFGRARAAGPSVTALIAGSRKPTPEVERLALWVRTQQARAKALAAKR